jgi:hypothetical protein
MNKRLFAVLLYISFNLLIISCQIIESQIVVTYISNSKYSIDTLIIKKNNIYLRKIKHKNDSLITYEGSWIYENGFIEFENFDINPLSHLKERGGFWPVKPEDDNKGTIKLLQDPTLNLYYIKKSKW